MPMQFANVPRMGRVNRYPKHSFALRMKPFEITPFMLAPVLPGETLKNLVLQSRVVTDPIKSPLAGWWLEYYIFYVKLRDLDGRALYESMMIDTATDVSTLRHASGNIQNYVADDDMNFTIQCVKRITEEFFRAEGEVWNTNVIQAGIPAAKLNYESWIDSVQDQTTMIDPLELTVDTLSGPSTDAVKISEIQQALRQYEFLQQNQLSNMTFEDYLSSYGIRRAQAEEEHRPELIRYVREWQYPSNTINATTGAPSSAVSWSVAERADKARFFKEPGFVFGVTVARPKMYLKNQSGSAAGLLDNAYAWLPAIMADDPRTSLKLVTANNGPLQATTNPYLVDVRDLFLYGDQFVNYDMATVTNVGNHAALPTADLVNKVYPSAADVTSLFSGAVEWVRSEGVVQLTVAGTQQDYT